MTHVRAPWWAASVLMLALVGSPGRSAAVGVDGPCKEVVCPGPMGQCDGGKACDPSSGLCVNLPDVAAGTPCEVDRDKCTRDECNGRGFCVRGPQDPICVPGPDLAIDKTAFCECVGPDGPEPRSGTFKDGRWSDDVVFCLNGALDGRACHIAFDIAVTNTGGVGATGVQVLDVLPSAVTFLGATATQGLYDLGTGVWDVGALGSAGSALLTIDVETGSPCGALLAVGASRSDHGGSDDKSHDHKSHDDKSKDDKSHDDKSHDDKSHDHKSDDHSSGDSKSDDHSSHGSKSDDDSSDDVRGRIRNCADLIAVEPPDDDPTNDSDCVIVSLVGGGCHHRVPKWFGRCLDRSSRLLTAAARADSPERARRLLGRAERLLDRANRGMAKLVQRGTMDAGCLDRLAAEVDGLVDEVRHLGP